MKMIFYVSLVLFSVSSAGLDDLPTTPAIEIVQKAKKECADIEDGEFHATEAAITLHDFTGDGRPEELVDASQFSCSTAASLWGGSGGTLLWVLIDGKTHELLAHTWRVVNVDDQKILLLAVHSSECSETVGACYRAFVWSDGFRTTR
jgi:hypothetical protein